MDEWLSGLRNDQCVLDLGAGRGSFDYSRYSCCVIAVDIDANSLRSSKADPRVNSAVPVNARSDQLPFRNQSFDLVICHHTLEHFAEVRRTLEEIARALKPEGRLYVAIPNGYGFDDKVYRFVLTGGGHVNRFGFSEVVRQIEEIVGVRLVRWKKLYSSFIYLRKPAPAVLPHLLGWFRFVAPLPSGAFTFVQFLFNVITRLMDRSLRTDLAVYGWALYFTRLTAVSRQEQAFLNVCMHCGAGHPASTLQKHRRWHFFYSCTCCGRVNPYFRPFDETL